MPLGGIVTLLILLPNALFLRYPPLEIPPEAPKTGRMKALEALERIGQIGCFVLPFFYPLRFSGWLDFVCAALFAAGLALYYVCWARYFRGGRKFALLFAPFHGIPLPMAVAPIFCFFIASLWLRTWPLAVTAVVLAVGHLAVSEAERKRSLI